MHFAFVAVLAVAVVGTAALSPALKSSASDQQAGGQAATQTLDPQSPVTARFTQLTDQRQVLGTQFEKTEGNVAENDAGLLMAVLSLESSTSAQEAADSVNQIVSLGVPQTAPPAAELTQQEAPSPTPAPEDAATEETDNDAGEACTPAGSGTYCIYTVVEGDTLSTIAQRLGFTGNGALSAADMLAQSNRPDVISSDHIEPGQNLRIPYASGIVHTVLFAETAGELAASYGVPLDAILSSPYNALGSDGTLLIGQEVFIPDPVALPVNEEAQVVFDEPTPESAEETADPTAEPEVEPTEVPAEPTATPAPTDDSVIRPIAPFTPTPEPTATPTATATATATSEPEDDPAAEATEEPDGGNGGSNPPAGDSLFIWPVSGPISSPFGPSHPLGIDIDLFSTPNAAIVAARGGEVVFAGGDPCCSYGYYVIIDHGNGVQTLYAHFSRIAVSQGERVSQGEVIGYGGRTGYATGNHLHFEIRVDGNVVNPMLYLP